MSGLQPSIIACAVTGRFPVDFQPIHSMQLNDHLKLARQFDIYRSPWKVVTASSIPDNIKHWEKVLFSLRKVLGVG